MRASVGRAFLVVIAGMLLSLPASAKWPSDSRVDRDVRAHWKKTWPDQVVEFVKKTTDCENAELEEKSKAGKVRMRKACLVKVDVYVARGFRYFIYRDTFVYYVRRKLKSLQLGELEKAWKQGGVPAPTPEEATVTLAQLAKEKLGASQVEISISEIGAPRPHGEFYRVTLVLDVAYTSEGKQEKREKVFATLQSDGTAWTPIAELAF